MSLHKSLKQKNSLVRRRNVLSRGERLERLKAEETWQEGESSVFGMPKVKVAVIAARRKKEEKPAEEAVEGEGAEGEATETEAAE